MSIEALTIVNNHIIDEDTGERTALPEAKIQLTELPPVEDADSLLPRKIQCSQCQTDIICDPDKATDGYWADLYGTVPPPTQVDGTYTFGKWANFCLACLRAVDGIEWMLRPMMSAKVAYTFRNPLAAQLFEVRRHGGEYSARQAIALAMRAEIAPTKGSGKKLRFQNPVTGRYEPFVGRWDDKTQRFVDLDDDTRDLLNEILDIMEPAPNPFSLSDLNLDVFQQEGKPKVKQGSSGSKRDRSKDHPA